MNRSKRPKKRNIILTISGISLVLIVLITTQVFLQETPDYAPRYLSNTVLLSAVFIFNIFLVFILIFVLGRNIIKLIFEWQKGTLGSKFNIKLVIIFISLSLIPCLLLFAVASDFIQKSVDRWFSLPVDRIHHLSEKIVEKYYVEYEERASEFARQIRRDLFRENLFSQDAVSEKEMHKKVKWYHFDCLNIYNRRGDNLVSIQDKNTPADVSSTPPHDWVMEIIRRKQETTSRNICGEGLILHSGVPILNEDTGESLGVVVASFYVNPYISHLAQKITIINQNYAQSRIYREPIKKAYISLFLMITLLVIFSASWIGLYMSRRITIPIQKLAEGTREISSGNLDYQVDAVALDEFGILIDSFNTMVQEVKTSKEKLVQSYQNLQKSNIELENRRRHIETILQNITAGVIFLDPSGAVTTINRAAATMLELKHVPATSGDHYKEFFIQPAFREIVELIERIEKVIDLSITRELHLNLDKRTIHLSINFSTLQDKNDKYQGMVIFLDDLTELIKAQKTIAWREVARRIAHEIKNPLTPIQLSAQRILKKYDEAGVKNGNIIRECTKTIVQEVNVIKDLVDEFSHFARMPAVHPVRANIHDILNGTLKVYEDLQKELSIERAFCDDMPDLLIDPVQIKQVLVNLFDNASEAMDMHGRLWVSTEFNPHLETAIIDIADEGRGISPEDRDKLFLPYFSTKKKGTGLGLAITGRIIADHNGYIRVEDNHPRGTRFIIELPVA